MLLLGVDVGTTGAKAIVFDEAGAELGQGFLEYGVFHPRTSWAEQDGEAIWSIIKSVIAQACVDYGKDVGALSVSVQGDAVIPIDANRNAIDAVQLGMDYRGVVESEHCARTLGDRELFAATGMRPHPMNSAVKMLWLKRHRPEVFARAHKLATYADFILGKLGSDDLSIDYSMASRTMAFDLRNRCWSESILAKLEIPRGKLSEPVPSGTVVGTVRKTLALELGLNPGATLVAGAHDQPCAAFGAGVIHENMALDSHGTAEVVSTVFTEPRLNDAMFAGYYPCYLGAVPDTYFTFSLNHTAGILLKWYVENFCRQDEAMAREAGIRLYEYVLQGEDAPSPIMVLPYFNGRGTPVCDVSAKGAILGLTLATTRHDIARAIVEALSFELRVNIEALRRAGVRIDGLRAVGGGARSPFGLQNKADILGLPVTTLRNREAACLGAAFLAGVAAKVYASPEEAVRVVLTDRTYYPRNDKKVLYDERYFTYESLYSALKNIRGAL